MCNTYKEKVPTVEGFQFDGANGQEIIDWLGGADYGVISGETLVLSPQGKAGRGQKVTVNRGQFVVNSNKGTSVVNEGEFIAEFSNEDGSDIVSLPPPPPEPPVAEDELVYQPGFRPLTEEDKKAKAEAAAKLEAKHKAEAKAEAKEESHRPVFGSRGTWRIGRHIRLSPGLSERNRSV
jgi:hypothetical protein